MPVLRERYSVMLNGYVLIAAGHTGPEALEIALGVIDGEQPAALQQVDIIEQNTNEKRARWRRRAQGWNVDSAPGWLS